MTTTHPATVGRYPVRNRERLTPWEIRRMIFRQKGSWFGGLNPREVHRFVFEIADDMESLYRELAEVHAENHRIKSALHEWQSAKAPVATSDAYRPPR